MTNEHEGVVRAPVDRSRCQASTGARRLAAVPWKSSLESLLSLSPGCLHWCCDSRDRVLKPVLI